MDYLTMNLDLAYVLYFLEVVVWLSFGCGLVRVTFSLPLR